MWSSESIWVVGGGDAFAKHAHLLLHGYHATPDVNLARTSQPVACLQLVADFVRKLLRNGRRCRGARLRTSLATEGGGNTCPRRPARGMLAVWYVAGKFQLAAALILLSVVNI